MDQPQFSAHLPRGPFKYMTTAPRGGHEGKGQVYLLDADGKKVATLWGSPDQKLAIAEFMIDTMDRKLAAR